ncbi:hypothetical protein [Clavibacter sp. MX14-G9D]|nr:hypothetical protein [Clavibacter sp. MX14-G9D]
MKSATVVVDEAAASRLRLGDYYRDVQESASLLAGRPSSSGVPRPS